MNFFKFFLSKSDLLSVKNPEIRKVQKLSQKAFRDFFLVLYPIMVSSGNSDQHLHSEGQSPKFEFFSGKNPN